MNIESLRMFCRVVDEGSISQAARSSYVTQPAVTRQIRQLENRYGTLLFDRTDGKLMLSDAGKTLYGYAKEIVEIDNISYEAIQELTGVQASVLKVGASLTIGEYLLPGLLGNFKKQHEEIKFSLSIGNTPYVLAKLEENEVDIALVESTVDNDDFKVQKFADDELILVTSHNHRWASRDYIDVQELAEEKMIWREKDSGTRSLVENALSGRGVLVGIQHAMELGSMQSIKSAVEADLGVSILPRLTVTKELKYKALREVMVRDFSIMRDLWIVQKQRRFKKSAETDFEEFLLH
ncbi:LysR family transcriptional regulator [Sediminibacillus halophilus]|uniref:DNA-binding transcriptional regulator, LysR family n=1 Tax=Sediminibacillus halophilus TaxID=482461 RepID=A0A1G9UCL6_9BACI|nr:LysR family transcriptional regulator [Sediminibacillus halophilus]SDM57454.1 DNA-binding transcriptional regulator, LysR family [Sediminibacillus halophilus]